MDYVNGFGVKPVESMENVKMNSKVEKLTSDSVKKIINDMIVDEFSKLLNPKKVLTDEEHLQWLNGIESIYEGNRLDYDPTEYKVNWDCEIDDAYKKFDTPDDRYGKIIHKIDKSSDIRLPEDVSTPGNYPYTGRGFTRSRNIVLPERK